MTGMDRHTGKALSGIDHLRQSCADILTTPVGTRIARRDYGSHLGELIGQPMHDLTRTRIFAATALAIARHEPRVRLSRVSLGNGDRPGSFTLTLIGRARDATGAVTTISISTPLNAPAPAPGAQPIT